MIVNVCSGGEIVSSYAIGEGLPQVEPVMSETSPCKVYKRGLAYTVLCLPFASIGSVAHASTLTGGTVGAYGILGTLQAIALPVGIGVMIWGAYEWGRNKKSLEKSKQVYR